MIRLQEKTIYLYQNYFVEAKPTYVSHHTTPYGVMQTGAEIHEALKNIKDKDRAVFF